MRYAYFPGCSLESTASGYDLSLRAVCGRLGVELEEIKEWNCCGATSAHSTDHLLSVALPARSLAMAPKGRDVAVACPACFLRLKGALRETRKDEELHKKMEEVIGLPCEAGTEVRHLLQIIRDDVGLDVLKARVVRPLAGLKLVAYYGCYLVRPPGLAGFDDAENPQAIDLIIEALGAEALDWSGKVDCCGGSLSLAKREIVVKLVGDLVRWAQEAGAEAMVTACPLCQSNLDARQKGLPVYYFSELIGLAMGITDARAWLAKHIVDPTAVLAHHGLL